VSSEVEKAYDQAITDFITGGNKARKSQQGQLLN